MQIVDIPGLEYRTQLAMANEEAGKLKATVFLQNLNHIEAQRHLFRNIKHSEGVIKEGNTSLTVTRENEVEVEHIEQKPIENLCATEKQRKDHVTEKESSQLLRKEFIEDLGNYGEGKET